MKSTAGNAGSLGMALILLCAGRAAWAAEGRAPSGSQSGLADLASALFGHPAVRSAAILAAALFIGYVAGRVLLRLILKWAREKGAGLEEAIVRHCKRPFLLICLLVAVWLAAPLLALGPEVMATAKTAHTILLTASISWLLVGGIRVVEALVLIHYDIKLRDNLKARTIYTQISVFRNVATFVILLVALALILMNFSHVRQLGVSVLASAGVAGIVVGFAAQKSIGTLLAGIQIAITQPIRLDDVVIVENEWGWIEEITLTYVVVRIWDLRRLVVPITYFIEKPFQNWTRTSADILGTVFFYVDYGIPLEPVRAELHRIVEASPLWDGKVCGLQVTNLTERIMEFRALMSSADSPSAWDLRCDVREKLIHFLQTQYPEHLPRIRASLEPEGSVSKEGPTATT